MARNKGIVHTYVDILDEKQSNLRTYHNFFVALFPQRSWSYQRNVLNFSMQKQLLDKGYSIINVLSGDNDELNRFISNKSHNSGTDQNTTLSNE